MAAAAPWRGCWLGRAPAAGGGRGVCAAPGQEDSVEVRLNPADGQLYTLGELLVTLAFQYERSEIRDWWDAACSPPEASHPGLAATLGPAVSSSAPPAAAACCGGAAERSSTFLAEATSEAEEVEEEEEEVRISPEDGQPYTFRQLLRKMVGRHTLRTIREFWDSSCRPVGGRPAQRAPAAPPPAAPLSRGPGGSRAATAPRRGPPPLEAPCPAELAEAARRKEAGNRLYSEHRFEEARAEYSRALAAVPAEVPAGSRHAEQLRARILNNRAACAQQLHEWGDVLADATAVLELEPGNFKALLRRAFAAEALEQFDSAFADAKEALLQEPGHPQASGIRNRCRDLAAEAAEARARRRLRPEAKEKTMDESMATFRYDDMEVLSRGFPWSSSDFISGEEENLALLLEFEREFASQVHTGPPHWWGLDDALADPENLRMAMDIQVAYIKNYQLDRADAVARYALAAAKQRGLPWNVKALQDAATLRMKQDRQVEAAVLLEEINDLVPPHPIHHKNLGTCYNSLKQHQRALEHFQEAVRLKDGEMDHSDRWDIGIAKKNLKEFDDAAQLLVDALEGSRKDRGDPVELAKLHDSVGGCYLEMGEHYRKECQYANWAEPHFRESERLFREAVGTGSPLWQGAVKLLSTSLRLQGKYGEAVPWLREGIRVEAEKDSIHPTPLHDMIEDLSWLAERGALENRPQYHELFERALQNLKRAGRGGDGNAGMVMHKVARFLMLSGPEYRPSALLYLQEALQLIRHHDEEVDLSGHCALLEIEIHFCEMLLKDNMLAICDGKC